MLNIEDMYLEMGIRREVYDFGSQIEGTLKERFDAIDKVAEYNQLKVVHAMQKCKVNAGCFKYAGRSHRYPPVKWIPCRIWHYLLSGRSSGRRNL